MRPTTGVADTTTGASAARTTAALAAFLILLIGPVAVPGVASFVVIGERAEEDPAEGIVPPPNGPPLPSCDPLAPFSVLACGITWWSEVAAIVNETLNQQMAEAVSAAGSGTGHDLPPPCQLIFEIFKWGLVCVPAFLWAQQKAEDATGFPVPWPPHCVDVPLDCFNESWAWYVEQLHEANQTLNQRMQEAVTLTEAETGENLPPACQLILEPFRWGLNCGPALLWTLQKAEDATVIPVPWPPDCVGAPFDCILAIENDALQWYQERLHTVNQTVNQLMADGVSRAETETGENLPPPCQLVLEFAKWGFNCLAARAWAHGKVEEETGIRSAVPYR